MIIVSFGIMYFGFFFFFLTTKFSLFNRGRGTQVTCACLCLAFMEFISMLLGITTFDRVAVFGNYNLQRNVNPLKPIIYVTKYYCKIYNYL